MHSTVLEHEMQRILKKHLAGSCAWGDVCKYAIGIFVHVIDICVHKRFGPQFEYKYKVIRLQRSGIDTIKYHT